jgi:hypothetical protein
MTRPRVRIDGALLARIKARWAATSRWQRSWYRRKVRYIGLSLETGRVWEPRC